MTTHLLAPVDGASMVVFRIGFGFLLAWWAIDYIISGRVQEMYVKPRFHFTYYLFHFVRPWTGDGMYVHFAGIALLAICVAAGFLYRITTVLTFIAFTYVVLLDRTNYQNHYYLLILICGLLALMPLNRCASVDRLADLVQPSSTVPRWCLWLLRFQLALPYTFGGIAKIHPDWLAGEPMRTHLMSSSLLHLTGSEFADELIVRVIVWGGLLFDLLIVPALLWRKTRTLAYILCLVFHVINSTLFQIHVFPWFMIFATTVFFDPEWPRRIWGGRMAVPGVKPITWHSLPFRQRLSAAGIVLYCGFQLLLPLRHHLFAGDPMWTERGHHFSWRMMLRAKASAVRYYVTDSQSGETRIPGLKAYLNMEQVSKFTRDPEMILQFAHFLASEYESHTGRKCQVRALVLTSLNGRKPQLLVDPNVDLAREPLGFRNREWILPLTEPLRKVAWSVPMWEWEQHIKLPHRPFLERLNVNHSNQ